MARPLLAGLIAAVVFASGVGVGARRSGTAEVDRRLSASTPANGGQPVTRPPSQITGQEDAVLAAAALTTMFDGAGLLDKDRRTRLLDGSAAAVARRQLSDELDEMAGLLGDALGVSAGDLNDDRVVWRSVPAGARLEHFGPDRAVVSVWGTGVVIVPSAPLVQPGWRTTTVEMVWEHEAWRLVSFRSEPGPQPPAVGGTPAAALQARLISEFEPLPFPTPSAAGP